MIGRVKKALIRVRRDLRVGCRSADTLFRIDFKFNDSGNRGND